MKAKTPAAGDLFLLAAVSLSFVASGCARSPSAATACGVSLQSWPEADALFRNDASWLGADAAYSVDLRGGRVLWLFGDTFVAKSPARSRTDAWFIRNSIAIQSGYDPSSAKATFAWQTVSGAAAAFFPGRQANWFWPLGGVRLASRLVLFLLEEEATSAAGFQAVGTKIVFVTNVDDAPSAWTVVDGNLPSFAFPVAFGAAVVADGSYVYAFGDAEPGKHSVYVARFDASALESGDASNPLVFSGGAWTSPSSVPPDTIFPSASTLENPPTEFSVQKRADGSWLAVHSVGFGATTIATRTAPAPEGPWSPPCDAFTPPESGEANVLVYAAKGHSELSGGSLVVTYATNGPPSQITTDLALYFPRFARASR